MYSGLVIWFQRIVLVLLCCSWQGLAWAQEMSRPYSTQIFLEDAADIKLESAAVFTAVTAVGLFNWNWGSNNNFKTNPEGWFGKSTGSGGTDKLGHAYSSYAITNGLAESLIARGRNPSQAALTSALISQAIMLYVEVFDGYSDDHGWSSEDVTMNLLGSSFAYLRHTIPGMRDLVDYRMEYIPSGYTGFRPLSDYAGQKYLFAFKLSGLEALRDTPLRYFELQTGYYARGFSKAEQAEGMERLRYGFVGVGLNVSELILGRRKVDDSGWKHAGQVLIEHVQIPHTAARTRWQF